MIEPAAVCVAGRASAGPWLFYMAPMQLGYAAWLVQGLVTGVATNIPAGEVNSDDNVGYGMAYPILSVKDVISEGNTQKFKFVDYPD